MKLLLDTHAWLWSLLEPARLGRRARRALQTEDNELWLSPVSVWETLVLADKGRLQLGQDTGSWLERALSAAPLHEAPLTHAIARASRALDLPHEDPADRFIAATAQVLDLTLVTADTRLLAARGFSVLRAG